MRARGHLPRGLRALKDEFHGHFKKSDYPDIYPEYDPMKADSEKNGLAILPRR